MDTESPIKEFLIVMGTSKGDESVFSKGIVPGNIHTFTITGTCISHTKLNVLSPHNYRYIQYAFILFIYSNYHIHIMFKTLMILNFLRCLEKDSTRRGVFCDSHCH